MPLSRMPTSTEREPAWKLCACGARIIAMSHCSGSSGSAVCSGPPSGRPLNFLSLPTVSTSADDESADAKVADGRLDDEHADLLREVVRDRAARRGHGGVTAAAVPVAAKPSSPCTPASTTR